MKTGNKEMATKSKRYKREEEPKGSRSRAGGKFCGDMK